MPVPRPIRARANCFCSACGQPIRAGRDRLMVRFRTKQWVHARRICLDSRLSYSELDGTLILVDVTPDNLAPADKSPASPSSSTSSSAS